MGDNVGTVIEDTVIPRRVRRPLDLARFVVALLIAAGIVLGAYLATSTVEGFAEDVVTGASMLPDPVVLAMNVVGGLGTLGLPVAAAISLLLRRRARQLFDALVAVLVAVIVLTTISWALTEFDAPRLLAALAGSTSADSAATIPILGGLIAFITVARLLSRSPWHVLSIVVIGSLVTVAVLNAGIALAGIGVSLVLGWAVGLLVRYVMGTPTTRPNGYEVAAAMARGGMAPASLTAELSTRRGRRYRAVMADGGVLRVTVLDRDLEGAGLVNAIWTALRVRGDLARSAFNMRRSLEGGALVSYAAQAAGAPLPQLRMASEIGPDSSLLAHDFVDGTLFADLPHLTDADLDGALRAVQILQRHQIVHRRLTAAHLLRGQDGTVWLVGNDTGQIAASDVALRIDISEVLCTLALAAGVERTVAAAQRVLGTEALTRALPTLQPVALSQTTRKALRGNRDVLVGLRDALVEIRPDQSIEQIQLERVRPRTLLLIIAGSFAGYALLSQLADVDLIGLISRANPWWILLALLLSIATYFGAAWSLSGFVPEHVPLKRNLLAQLAGDFATLVSPPTLGAVAINMRFLQRAGLHPALAAASVGVSQVMAFVVYLVLLIGFGIAAGTQTDFTFDPPRLAVIAVVVVAIGAISVLAVPAVRRRITQRVGPILREVGPRLVTVAQRPAKLAEGIGGHLLLNFAYIGVLLASVEAFGGDLNISVIAVVYLAGATIGQAAPTPGGLGAVEAALAAGLTAAGLEGSIAVSAVLLYRLVTFWLPTIPGYWAFGWLTRHNAL